ncbi:MAG: hypothetical protein ACO2PN_20405 [Pyrobaculum sp.]
MGKTQTLKMFETLAKQVVLLSGDNVVVAIDDGRVFRLMKGQYGGWLLREKNAPEALHGLWCYKTSKKKASQKDLEKAKDALERLKKIAESLGIRTGPNVSMIMFKYRIVAAKREKATDRYSVYEITPTNEEASAAAIRIGFPYKLGKYGRCANDVCRHYNKLKKLIEAEFGSSEALVAGVSIVVPLDTSGLEEAVAKLLGVEEVGDAGGELEKGGEEEGGGKEEESGGAKRYLVALLPGSVDEDAVADTVRETLKKLGIKNPLVKVVEAEV